MRFRPAQFAILYPPKQEMDKPPSTVLGLLFLANLLLFPGIGRAQATDAAETGQDSATAEVERVIVTGSAIPTAEEVGPNPVLTITRDLIEKSGERTAEELIRNTTVAGPNGVPSSNNGVGLTPGASSISLRGFDASSTLTLIDGRRVAPYPLGTGNGAQTFVDLNSIPRAAIESIEILKDGASATYGADAVAGVVNIKFRHDYRGAESDVEYGNTLDKDSSEFAASLVFGVGNDKTSVSGVLNFYHRNSIFNRDRGYFFDYGLPIGECEPGQSSAFARRGSRCRRFTGRHSKSRCLFRSCALFHQWCSPGYRLRLYAVSVGPLQLQCLL